MLKKHLKRPQTQPSILKCLLDHVDEGPLANIRIKCQRWQAKLFITGLSKLMSWRWVTNETYSRTSLLSCTSAQKKFPLSGCHIYYWHVRYKLHWNSCNVRIKLPFLPGAKFWTYLKKWSSNAAKVIETRAFLFLCEQKYTTTDLTSCKFTSASTCWTSLCKITGFTVVFTICHEPPIKFFISVWWRTSCWFCTEIIPMNISVASWVWENIFLITRHLVSTLSPKPSRHRYILQHATCATCIGDNRWICTYSLFVTGHRCSHAILENFNQKKKRSIDR